jgi:hypothetical protein
MCREQKSMGLNGRGNPDGLEDALVQALQFPWGEPDLRVEHNTQNSRHRRDRGNQLPRRIHT